MPRTTIDSYPSDTTIDNTPTFGFDSDDDGSTFECRLTEVETTPGDFNSCTSSETYPEQSDGTYIFEVRATDVAGNTANPPARHTFNVDTQAPDPPVIAEPANNSYDTDGDITFSGTAEAGSTVQLFEGTQSKDTTTTDDEGGWRLNLTGVADGAYTYAARATDATGNTSSSSDTVAVTVNSTEPETTIDSGPSRVVSDRSASFEFSSEADATFECSLDGATFTVCSSPYQYNALDDGEHALEVRATDVAGNTDTTPATRTWTVDTVMLPPVISRPDYKGYDKNGVFKISGTAEPNASVELSEEATSSKKTTTANDSGDWSVNLTGVAEGKHTYTASATDAAGNTETSARAVMIVHKAAPTVTRAEPADGATGRSIGRNVVARFSERMNPDTLTARNVMLANTRTGAEVKAKVHCDDLCRTLRLDPDRNLERNTKYRVLITTRMEDLAGNRLAQNMVWHFTTEA